MDFEAFLAKKRIDSTAFHQAQGELWSNFSRLYAQVGPKSFDLQKKFFFNDLRALYPMPFEAKKPGKPSVKPKLSLKKTITTSGQNKPKLEGSVMKKSEDSKAKPKPKLARPMMKKPEDSESKSKPKLARPVMKKPEDSESKPKPKLARPVMKKSEDSKAKPKPKLARPVMKKSEDSKAKPKPKLARPVMKKHTKEDHDQYKPSEQD